MLTVDSPPELLGALGTALMELGRPHDALGYLRRAVQADSNDANAHFRLGVLLNDRMPEALPYYDRAVELRPDRPDYRTQRAQQLLALGDYVRGWVEYEWRWHTDTMQRGCAIGPQWDGSSPQGWTLLLQAEQGVGDTIQFVALTRRWSDAWVPG